LIGPKGVRAFNPAFDVTPSKNVTAIITEKGLVKPPYRAGIRRIFGN
jgi:methylthioribose-1-phosphate isomerase